ncbi:MAG: MYG1 family protein [Myxococcales bacterium]|nr:MYG1 family protein [Myxococcales bacterium]
MIHTILTHPGGAHKDDLLAVCVLAAEHGAPIVRRDPSEAELDDPGVAIVDIGGRHEPARANFDHHHFDRDHPPTCALSLVLDHLGLYEEAKALCDWLEPAEYFDSRGPKRTAEWLGVPRRAISQLNSPIDVTLLRRFAARRELAPGDPLYEVMRYVGQDLLDYLRNARERIAEVRRHVVRWTLAVGDEHTEALFLPRSAEILDEPSSALAAFIRADGLEAVISTLVYPDRRGPGYGISRYEDHPALDFTRVASEPDVHFAHASGFVCKTTASDEPRLRELVTLAWKR